MLSVALSKPCKDVKIGVVSLLRLPFHKERQTIELQGKEAVIDLIFGFIRKRKPFNHINMLLKRINSIVSITVIKWTAFFIVVGLVGMIVFFGPTDNWSWDPSFYYAQLRSPIIENDLDFSNETIITRGGTRKTVTGLQHSPWPIGPSILWSPFFLVAHLVVLIVRPSLADGFYFPYITLVSLGSAIFGIVALIMIYRICRYFGNKSISVVTTLLCLGATPLFFYIFRQPIMAHTTGLFASASIVLVFIVLADNQQLKNRSGLMFGVCLGLNFLTRWAGVLLAVLPLTYFIDKFLIANREKNFLEIKSILRQILIMGVTFVLTISPQMILWYRIHRKLIVSPQGARGFIDSILPINLFDVFVHTNRGLVFWSPFILIGMFGITRIPDKRMKLASIIYMLSLILLIGYRRDWYSGGGFGARYFIESLPLLAIGFVILWRSVPRFISGNLFFSCLSAALVLHQLVLMHAVEFGAAGWINLGNYSNGEPIGLGWQYQSLLKLLKDPNLWLLPRPYVGQDRQTILVNFLAGVKDLGTYLIPGLAVILSPMAVISLSLLRRIKIAHLRVISVGIMVYMVLWSIYLLVIG